MKRSKVKSKTGTSTKVKLSTLTALLGFLIGYAGSSLALGPAPVAKGSRIPAPIGSSSGRAFAPTLKPGAPATTGPGTVTKPVPVTPPTTAGAGTVAKPVTTTGASRGTVASKPVAPAATAGKIITVKGAIPGGRASVKKHS